MVELTARAVAYAALMGVAVCVAALIRRRSAARDVHAMPDARRRTSLLARLREMRAGGTDLDACMQFLRSRGLRRGVARGLIIDLERQQLADVTRPRDATWNGYAFRYPGNWKLAPLVPEAGEAAGICVEGTGSAMLMLVREAGAHARYEELVTEQEAQIRHPQRTHLSIWGGLPGRGAELNGPHAKLKLLVHIQVFRPSAVPVPFTLVQFHAVEEEPLVMPGFQLVQATLRAEPQTV